MAQKMAGRQTIKWADDLEQVMGLLPQTKWLFTASWKASTSKSGLGRLWHFGKLVLVNFTSIE
jgi:hypothetical protein